MASQTGTLKFRQSDGTYTELYPKTTIAQVDGLQTQLNNINASLQNKVDLTTTNAQHINGDLLVNFPKSFVVNGTSQYANVEVFLYPYAHHLEGGGCIIAKYTKDNIAYFSTLGVNREQVEYLVQNREGTVVKDEILATQSYVTNQIQGAINASY